MVREGNEMWEGEGPRVEDKDKDGAREVLLVMLQSAVALQWVTVLV